jgi:thiol-disulfide isomerase/thioredoxin
MSRRSIIAAAAGLAAAAGWGKFSAAQIAESDLPDAAEVMTRMAPVVAPPMVFTNVKGKRLTLADYVGHPLLVNLWATWCGPCVAELPTFARLAPKLKSSGALILPVSVDLEGAAAVTPFYISHGIKDLPILLDPNGDNMNVLNTDGIPVTIVINAAGQMVARLDGAADWNTDAVVEFMRGLGGKPPAAKKKKLLIPV